MNLLVVTEQIPSNLKNSLMVDKQILSDLDIFLSIEQFLVLIRHMFYVTYSELEVHKTELLGKVT